MNKLLNRMTVSKRINILIIVSVVALIAVTVIGIVGTDQGNRQSDHLRATALGRKTIVASMTENIESLIKNVNRMTVAYSFDKDKKMLDDYTANVQSDLAKFDEQYTAYHANLNNDRSLTDDARNLLLDRSTSLSETLHSYVDTVNERKKLFDEYFDDQSKGYNTIQNKIDEARETSAVLMEDLEFLKEKAIAREEVLTEETNKELNAIMVTLVIIPTLIIILVILLAIAIAKSISSPINKLKNLAEDIASGKDVQLDLSDKPDNELTSLQNSISNMLSKYNQLINVINDSLTDLKRGILSTQVNTREFEGFYREYADLTNETIQSISQDYQVISRVLNDYSSGDFSTIMPELAGEKQVVTDSLNNIRTGLDTVSNVIIEISNKVSDGDLNYEFPENKSIGKWQEIELSLKSLVTAIKEPTDAIRKSLDEISNGNLRVNMDDSAYKGDFKEMAQALNTTAQTMNTYVKDISDILHKMATKDLRIKITTDYIGDFSPIKESLNLIVKSLNDVFHEIKAAAEQVGEGSKSIAQTATQLATSAESQGLAINDLNKTVAELQTKNTNTTSKINQSNSSATNAKTEADEVKEQMKQMLSTMDEVVKSSNNIGNILKKIDEIAFQTNILALNASVEAARAGEHGKGFAVVADEVRNLATKSLTNSKESATLVEEALKNADLGMSVASKTSESVTQIISRIDEISDLSAGIVADTQDQKSSIESVSKTTQITQRTSDDNRDASATLAAASQELASQSYNLNNMIDGFKLR